ncbi:unnamed protein product [Caenorhabditis auriculariae]|uniref:MH2 domain-containing protein n=1 Tax=Caenorhabditis auriculariae TaxID=2777116 RepID=A0A8S1HKN2_9PELO|nr:unnamed protein product [Caenorhabditis auriculariae]
MIAVFFSNASENSRFFVQTLSANLTHGFHLNTVSKVLPGRCNMKIFNNAQFAEQLALAAEKSYQDVYSLSRMCTIRMSFFKGWGDSYKRSNVLMTPCWIEAHLNGPLQWIDRVLTCMRSPSKICSSFT